MNKQEKLDTVKPIKCARCRNCAYFERGDNPRFGYCRCRHSERFNKVVPAVLFMCEAPKMILLK